MMGSRWVGTLLWGLAVWGVGLTPGDALAQDETPAESAEAEAEASYDSPEAVFAAAQSAFNARDWAGFVDLVSPARRNQLVGQTAIAFATIAQQPDADPAFKALVEEYLPRDLDPMQLAIESENPQADAERLAKRIGKPKAFFAAAMKLAFDQQHPDEAEAPKVTATEDLVVAEDGRTATGEVRLAAGETESRDTWSYEQFDGSWWLSMR